MDRPDEERLPERARREEPFGFGVGRVVASHEADLQPGPPVLGRGNDAVALLERQSHRLLEQNVLAPGEGPDRLLGVNPRRRRSSGAPTSPRGEHCLSRPPPARAKSPAKPPARLAAAI